MGLGFGIARLAVYNFALADFHTYYVTEADILVHNCGSKNPNTIMFSQNTVNGSVDGSKNLNDLIAKYKAGVEIDPIRIIKFKNLPADVQENLLKQGVSKHSVFTLDNRRLFAARKAGVNINTVWATLDDLAEIDLFRRFSTVNGGKLPKVK